MGIVNKSFSFFNKGIGAASGFAKNHLFPAMKTDYMAVKAGIRGVGRGAVQGNYGPGVMGGAMEVGNIARRGFKATTGSYRGAGVTPGMGGLRLGGYAAAGMWGLNRITRD